MAPDRRENAGWALRDVELSQAARPKLAESLRRVRRNKEYAYDGHSDGGARRRLVRTRDRLCLRLRTAVTERIMIFDYALAGAVSFGLLIYLTYALLRPERF
jgi:K+-transporting ATPase ATPase F chain